MVKRQNAYVRQMQNGYFMLWWKSSIEMEMELFVYLPSIRMEKMLQQMLSITLILSTV